MMQLQQQLCLSEGLWMRSEGVSGVIQSWMFTSEIFLQLTLKSHRAVLMVDFLIIQISSPMSRNMFMKGEGLATQLVSLYFEIGGWCHNSKLSECRAGTLGKFPWYPHLSCWMDLNEMLKITRPVPDCPGYWGYQLPKTSEKGHTYHYLVLEGSRYFLPD